MCLPPIPAVQVLAARSSLRASDRHTQDGAYEGHTFNINDANSATWGATPGLGGGSNHVKVRYTPTQWSVVGK